jgi:hypothetical protein
MGARLMRRILVDRAIARYQKRGGGAQRVSFTQALEVAEGQPTDVVALNDAPSRRWPMSMSARAGRFEPASSVG